MASIKAKKGKKDRLTYYITHSYQEYALNGSKKNKVKWIKIGTSKVEADQALREFHREYKTNRNQFTKIESMLFSRFVEDKFIPWCEARKGDRSFRATKDSLNLLCRYFGRVTLQDIDVHLVEQFITWLLCPELSPLNIPK